MSQWGNQFATQYACLSAFAFVERHTVSQRLDNSNYQLGYIHDHFIARQFGEVL